MNPKVSILLPNLNTRPFLRERLDSILQQTIADWELVVVDNYSDDGAWEVFQDYARREPRMRILQAPREGWIANWNNALRLARGQYIYYATSDDSMSPDCIEKMQAALEAHPDCHIAHCCLTIIDETGKPVMDARGWDQYEEVLFFGDMIHKAHVRLAPHDGILSFFYRTAYKSMTQILVRKDVYDTVGDFQHTLDVEFQMRAGSLFNTIHIPEYLATWRIYSDQGSAKSFTRMRQDGSFLRAAESALAFLREHHPAVYRRLDPAFLLSFHRAEYEGLQVQSLLSGGSSKMTHAFRLLREFKGERRGLICRWGLRYLRSLFVKVAAPDPLSIHRELHRLAVDKPTALTD